MASTPFTGETELVSKARSGDRAAFDRLVIRYRPLVMAVAYQRTADRDDAADLTQEILTRAWSKLPALDNDALFVPWLKSIAANACLNWCARRRPPPVPLDDNTTAAAVFDGRVEIVRHFRRLQIKRALAAIPPMNRMALLLHVLGGYAYAEIAELCGASANTVAGRINRAKAQLRALLPDQGAQILALTRDDKKG